MPLPSRYLPEVPDPYALSADPPPRAAAPAGVLLVNLGTPEAPTPRAIRRYLREFLSDPRVVELPAWLWQPLLRLFVLARRPSALAPRYREIWLPGGSPLLVWSQTQADGLQARLQARGLPVKVALGMRYGEPSLAQAVDRLRAEGCDRILMLPLYPQYAASTTATAVDKIAAHLARLRDQPALRTLRHYPEDPAYIGPLAELWRRHWQQHGRPQRLLLSFHGLPRRSVLAGDSYHRDCRRTAAALREALGEHGDFVQVAFQSRFGADRWLEPATEAVLRAWPGQGITSVDVACPGFVADCLETLEEIQMQCRDAFLASGGQHFRYLPCLNDDPAWLDGLAVLARRHLAGWV